jgi:hypothetical protein
VGTVQQLELDGQQLGNVVTHSIGLLGEALGWMQRGAAWSDAEAAPFARG